jgi:hypothetical protein
LNLASGTVRIERSLTELPGGGYLFGPPRSEAGHRVVAIPRAIRPELKRHLSEFVVLGDNALVFTSPTGAPLRHGNFRRRSWLAVLAKAGLTSTHFHDLRHTGNNLIAESGATLRELMDRMGTAVAAPRSSTCMEVMSASRRWLTTSASGSGLSRSGKDACLAPLLASDRARGGHGSTSQKITVSKQIARRLGDLRFWGVGLGGLEPPTSSLSGKIWQWLDAV